MPSKAASRLIAKSGKDSRSKLGYLFVGAHKLVRGNNINIPCPYGTAKPNNPYYAQGLLDPSGSLTAVQRHTHSWAIWLGAVFRII